MFDPIMKKIHEYSTLFMNNNMNKAIIDRLSSDNNIIQHIIVKYKQENNIMNYKIPIEDYQRYVNSLDIKLKFNDQCFYDELHDYLIQTEFNVSVSYDITSAIFPNTKDYVITTLSVVESNFENEFFLRLVMKNCNELKSDFKTSYKKSINEVKWKYPTMSNVKKND